MAWEEANAEVAVQDVERQSYLHDHIEAVGQAIELGCDVKGYFVWSFQVRSHALSLSRCIALKRDVIGQFGMGFWVSNALWSGVH